MTIDLKRLQRAWRRVSSRWADYSQLRSVRDKNELRRWFLHNDPRMLNGNVLRAKVVQAACEAASCDVFVETGTSHAATAIGVHRFLGLPVWSCENSPRDYWISRAVTFGMQGLSLRRCDSRQFLKDSVERIKRGRSTPLFYLDAHEGALDRASLPLADELQAVSSLDEFVVVIDDFKIPDDSGFVYGTYGGVPIDVQLLRVTLKDASIDYCYFPSYRSSEDTGFVTGYCLLWRSIELDKAFARGTFPLNLVRSFHIWGDRYADDPQVALAH